MAGGWRWAGEIVLKMVSDTHNIDCMEFMAGLPDKFFDLVVADPPYAVGASDGRFGGQFKKPSKVGGKLNAEKYANHDKPPGGDFFKEVFRVSKNQIIWGSNYYPQHLYHSGAIVWDKLTVGPLSDCEIAFQSFNKLVYKFTHGWSGYNKGGDKSERIHPNQKPIRLYKYLFSLFSHPGQRVLDTHLGSGSSRIAAYDLGIDFYGCELHGTYFKDQEARFKAHAAKPTLFAPKEMYHFEQAKLFQE